MELSNLDIQALLLQALDDPEQQNLSLKDWADRIAHKDLPIAEGVHTVEIRNVQYRESQAGGSYYCWTFAVVGGPDAGKLLFYDVSTKEVARWKQERLFAAIGQLHVRVKHERWNSKTYAVVDGFAED